MMDVKSTIIELRKIGLCTTVNREGRLIAYSLPNTIKESDIEDWVMAMGNECPFTTIPHEYAYDLLKNITGSSDMTDAVEDAKKRKYNYIAKEDVINMSEETWVSGKFPLSNHYYIITNVLCRNQGDDYGIVSIDPIEDKNITYEEISIDEILECPERIIMCKLKKKDQEQVEDKKTVSVIGKIIWCFADSYNAVIEDNRDVIFDEKASKCSKNIILGKNMHIEIDECARDMIRAFKLQTVYMLISNPYDKDSQKIYFNCSSNPLKDTDDLCIPAHTFKGCPCIAVKLDYDYILSM